MNVAQLKYHVKDLCKFLREKSHDASAEVSAMSEFLRKKEISLVYLLHTDTPVGRCCAEALRIYLKENGVESELREIKGYAGGPETFRTGLMNLMTETHKILASHEKVRICATGGYKPESVIVSVLGFIMGASVYYIHTTFRQVVHLPALPLDWGVEIKNHRKAIDELLSKGSIPRKEFIKEFGHEAADDLEGIWLLEKQNDDYVLAEIGKALLKILKTYGKTETREKRSDHDFRAPSR